MSKELYDSKVLPYQWEKLLGSNMIYSFGEEYVVNDVVQLIPPYSYIIDCGCGWGGPAKILSEQFCNTCKIACLTNSDSQFTYLQNREIREKSNTTSVMLCDLDCSKSISTLSFPQMLPPLKPIAIFIQSFTHLTNPLETLKSLREYHNIEKILISDYLAKGRQTIKNSAWVMSIYTIDDFKSIFNSAGYEIETCKIYENSKELIKTSAQKWLRGLNELKLNIHENSQTHMSLLKKLCNNIVNDVPIGYDLVLFALKNGLKTSHPDIKYVK